MPSRAARSDSPLVGESSGSRRHRRSRSRRPPEQDARRTAEQKFDGLRASGSRTLGSRRGSSSTGRPRAGRVSGAPLLTRCRRSVTRGSGSSISLRRGSTSARAAASSPRSPCSRETHHPLGAQDVDPAVEDAPPKRDRVLLVLELATCASRSWSVSVERSGTVPRPAFRRGSRLIEAARVPRGQPQLETSARPFAPQLPDPVPHLAPRLARYWAPAATASPTPTQKSTIGQSVPFSVTITHASEKYRIQVAELAEPAHLELVAAGHDELVAEHEDEVAAEHEQRGRPRQPPVAHSRTTATPIISRSASGSATLPKPTRRASGAPASRRAGRWPPRRRRRCLPPRPRRRRRRRTARRTAGWPRSGAIVSAFGIVTRRAMRTQARRRHSAPCPVLASRAVAGTLALPGFVNAHSHAFQRALRGRARAATSGPGATACSPRPSARRPSSCARSTARRTARCAAAGYTAVGEFHYLGLAGGARGRRGGRRRRDRLRPASTSRTPAAGWRACGSRPWPSTSPRSRRSARADRASALAPHSVRACPRDWLEEIGALRGARGAPAARPRLRAAARDRGVPRRARLPPDRAARAHRLPRRADDGRPRDARRRRRARPARRRTGRRSAPARRPRRTSATASSPPSASAHRGDPALHRLRLERPHRPARGAARARGDRAPAERPARRLLDRRAATRSAARSAAARSGSTRWPEIEVDLDHRSLAGVAPSDVPRGARRGLRRRRRSLGPPCARSSQMDVTEPRSRAT